MHQVIKVLTNILCLILILILPGSGLIIILLIHDRLLLLNVLRGKRNIIPVLKDVLNESYSRYFNSRNRR